jgi:hypothetical protein
MNIAQAIAEVKTAAAKSEAAIAAVPSHLYVIVWHDCCLKTDGKKVAILGPAIYTGTRQFMAAECAKWNAAIEGKDDSPAIVMSQAEALAHVQQKNADMLAALPKV